MIATFIAIFAFCFTLNFLTLMALSLCIGLLIDDSIVVRENIVRHLGLGKDHVMDRVERGIKWVHVLYGQVLVWALRHRVKVLAIALVSFFGSFLLVPLIGTEFVPEADESFLSLRLNTPVGSSLEYTDGKVKQVEATLQAIPGIALMMTTVGTEDGRNYARINLKLVERKDRAKSQKEIERAIRAALKPIPGIEPAFGFDRPVWVNLLGPDPETMTRLLNEFAAKVATVPGIADLEISEKAAQPALSIRLNHEAAADLGITVQQVGATVRPLLAGDTVSYWLGPDGQNYEVNVQLAKDRRRLVSDLGNLYLTSAKRGPDGELRMVPLRQVAEIVETTSPQIIKRQELQRRVALYANAEGRPSGDVNADVDRIMKATTLPPGYRFDVGGQAKDMQESFQAALAALGLAVIFIYLILASQFASFTQPLAIMASLPFSLIGVFLALLLTGTTLNLFSIIGFIMLMGLVTKNAILLVDFANRARRGGAGLVEALLQSGQVRLRPILMTTAAMIGGMLPLALGFGEGGETQAPMGRAIIGGVITSTLLTLVVVPVLYTYLDAWHERRKARRMARAAAVVAGPASTTPARAD